MPPVFNTYKKSWSILCMAKSVSWNFPFQRYCYIIYLSDIEFFIVIICPEKNTTSSRHMYNRYRHSSSEVRSQFLEFFQGNGHKHIASSPVLPENDPSLLFVNAGMVQFKPVLQVCETKILNLWYFQFKNRSLCSYMV